MRVLLDEQLPRHLARELTGHTVRTVQQEGWAGFKNGELLQRAADGGFDVFLTADQNLQFQQNLAGLVSAWSCSPRAVPRSRIYAPWFRRLSTQSVKCGPVR